ncbi:MAG: FAD-dependent oxidoreductase [Candidatus Paceibacterota bacterium]|jgi:sulfide:quinone oxidoreductase
MKKPHVVVLGGNFAGMGSAQKVREYAGDAVDITVIDRKDYLIFVPNIPNEVFENRDPEDSLKMDIPSTLKRDGINFIQAEVTGLNADAKTVTYVPTERPGAEAHTLQYDYVVVAVGCRLAFDKIPGFAEYGDTVSDFYHANRLRKKLHGGGYKGGPIVVGSALWHQGDGAKNLKPYGTGSIPAALAACEGPTVETSLALATWLKNHNMGDAKKITITTPAAVIAEDAGEKVVGTLLGAAGSMGFNYVNNTRDIVRLTETHIEFEGGQKIEAEIKIIFPDWEAYAFLKGNSISDNQGFVITDLLMRNPKYPEVFAAGDCAAVTVPKLGSIGHEECEIVGRQIAAAVGRMTPEKANIPLNPVVLCIGDMGDGKAFYIRSNSWYGGPTQELRFGRRNFFLKMRYKNLFFWGKGKTPSWGNAFAEWWAEVFK